MSKTIRKRRYSFRQEFYCDFNEIETGRDYFGRESTDKSIEYSINRIKRFKHRYYTDLYSKEYNVSKWFRKAVNTHRRLNDKIEIYKSININDYEGNFSKWNCKDDESWWYW